jgi:energy-coupling factor transport system permease protein
MFQGLFQYVDKDSFIHRLNPRVKLLLLVPIFLLAIAINGIVFLSIVLSFILMLYLIARIPRPRYRAILVISLISSISFFFFGMFFYFGFYQHAPGSVTVLFWIFRPEQAVSLPIIGPIILFLTQGRGIVIAEEGLVWGTVTTLKFSVALFSSNLMIMTTKPKEILIALNKLGVPIKLTFVAMTALRFVPVVMEEWYTSLSAQQARGMKIKRLDIKGMLSMLTTTLSMLVVNSIKRARILALAMETRAFGANVKKVSYDELKMTRLDVALTVTITSVTVVLLFIIVLFPYHTGYTL